MSFISQDIINEICTKADIVEVISQSVSLKKQGKNYVGLCPFHLEDTPSFSVSPDKQIFYCFGCQKGGSVITFLMESENITFPEAVESLAEKLGISLPAEPLDHKQLQKQSEMRMLLKIHEAAEDFFHESLLHSASGKIALEYLERREISRETLINFKIGYAPNSWDSLIKKLTARGMKIDDLEKAGLAAKSSKETYYDKFRNRLMIPIRDYRGKVIAFGGRVLGDELPKYLNSPETPIFSKSRNLFGLDLAAGYIRQVDEAIIMEGYMDVIMAHQRGIRNAVASLGTAFTPDQGKLLKRYTSNVLIAYDADTAGGKATARGMEILHNLGFVVRILRLPQGKDPDDFLRKNDAAGWHQLVQEKAQGFLEYKLQLAIEKHNIDTIEGKSGLVKELLPEIAAIKSQVEMVQYVKLVAASLEIPEEAIYADLRKNQIQIKKMDFPSRAKPAEAARSQRKEPADVSISKKSRIAERNLCRMMLEDQNTYDQVARDLGLDFSENEKITRIISFVQEIYHEYDWIPATLVDRISQPELKNYLTGLMMDDVPEEHARELLIRDYLNEIKERQLKKQIQDIQTAIKSFEEKGLIEDTARMLQELIKLQRQVQQLKQ